MLLSLRDIHIPQAPESASITWLLVSALVLAVIFVAVSWLYLQRRRAALYEVRQCLNNIQTDSPQAAMELASILRRIMHQSTGDKINGLQNRAWLEQLDQHFSTQFFTQGNGQLFGDALYKNPDSDVSCTTQNVRKVREEINQANQVQAFETHV